MSMAGRTVGRATAALVAVALAFGAFGLAAPPASASSRAEAEAAFVAEINRERRSAKLGELAVNPGLAEIASEWSREMARSRELGHNDRLRQQVEQSVTKDWKRLGENVGWTRKSGATDPELVQALHRAFMDSEGHRANVLGAFNQVGVGVRRNADGTMWVTVVFMDGPSPSKAVPDANGFVDVAGVHAPNIAALVEAGIAGGYGDGHFRPKEPVSRGQMATFIANALGLSPNGTNAFSDPPSTHLASINALAAEGIAGGYPDGTYRPHGTVTRGQMAKFLVTALGLEPIQDGPFSDVGGSTFRAEINALAAADIAGGFSDGTFRPNRTVSREQMASFLTAAFNL